LTPEEVARRENIFDNGTYKSRTGTEIANCDFGASLLELAAHLPQEVGISELIQIFRGRGYILWCAKSPSRVFVVLKEGVSAQEQLRAWYHGQLLARRQECGIGKSQVTTTSKQVQKTFDDYALRLRAAGWDLNVPVLETRSGSRIVEIRN
jgi:hypothetical protein